MDTEGTRAGQDETPKERLNRKWNDQLQELRVMQTGAQLTAGFLLTLPFQQTFKDLDDVQRTTYLSLVVLAVVTTALILGSVAVHRRLTGMHVKERVVTTTHWLMAGVLTCLGLLLTVMTFFIFDVVVTGRVGAVVAGASVGVVVLVLLVALPFALRERDVDPSPVLGE